MAAVAALAVAAIACAVLPPFGHARARARPAASCTGHPAAVPPGPSLAALLPISPAQLRAAAALAARFAAAYDTIGPGQHPGAWLARLAPMATRQLAGALARTAATPALWQQHRPPEAGQATAGQIRDLTPASVIFTVHIREDRGAGTGPGPVIGDLAVTIVRSSTGWAVYDIEPAGDGNTG